MNVEDVTQRKLDTERQIPHDLFHSASKRPEVLRAS